MITGLIGLLVVLLLVLLYPAIRNAQAEAATPGKLQAQENLRLYKERVADVEAMDISEDDRKAMMLELDRELLAAADKAAGFHTGPGKAARFAFTSFLILLSLAATYSLYMSWGAGNEVRATQLLEYSATSELSETEYKELEKRLDSAGARDPENLEWAFLRGRLLEAEARFAEAAEAYENLLTKLPDEQVQDRAAIMTSMVQARFFSTGQQATDELYNTLKEALALAPGQRKPLGLAGIMAYELGNYQQAIEHWKALWIQLPEGSMEARTIANGIGRAAEVLEEQGTRVDLSWMVPARVEVSVALADDVRQQVPVNATVFVLARKLDGPPMPLAVQRLVVSQLPTTVVLDNSMAMAAGASIGDVDEVTITARVSLSGQPMAQAGDWQGQVFNVPTRGSEAIQVTISEQVSGE
ncbi:MULTISPECIES: c-type cytochrome biogenesis protein CcmI [Thalassolituus]|uniref:c-type cytochrome biogenesis protein CcmI n=1 Tax=Thalassolituus TaxID=187492 RepID=UPI000C64E126|nr:MULTISPECIES: c-type cytochrome biogenesis protein CcmI [Thalassolituus]MAX86808.1 c-type cytochrome biogenesis protein CcmI [Oceanospirillaceae bacterium]|tara:strand:+ start:6648 stop:7886 length:1239 start_codon:yes stop_codon:yes gene_type:complete